MVESVTVMLPHSTVSDNLNYTSIYNFPAFQSFDEHKITRHILPPEATAAPSQGRRVDARRPTA